MSFHINNVLIEYNYPQNNLIVSFYILATFVNVSDIKLEIAGIRYNNSSIKITSTTSATVTVHPTNAIAIMNARYTYSTPPIKWGVEWPERLRWSFDRDQIFG